MDTETLLTRVKNLFSGDASGHDFYHTLRVYRTAMAIAREENCNREIVMLGALLHDADDKKLFATENYANAHRLLQEYGASPEVTRQVIGVISTVSFGEGKIPDTIEGKIVQDADRLDALGAVGIARTFAYGGSRGLVIHDPEILPQMGMTPEQYRSHKGTSVNHFYEKLLCLKDTLHTQTAKKIAEKRHQFMEEFLEEFLAQWDGKR